VPAVAGTANDIDTNTNNNVRIGLSFSVVEDLLLATYPTADCLKIKREMKKRPEKPHRGTDPGQTHDISLFAR